MWLLAESGLVWTAYDCDASSWMERLSYGPEGIRTARKNEGVLVLSTRPEMVCWLFVRVKRVHSVHPEPASVVISME